jgi:SprT-like family
MRKLCALVVAAAVIIFSIRAAATPKSAVDAHFLQAIYADYNETYFNNELPRNTKIFYASDPDGADDIGDTICSMDPSDPSNLKVLSCTIYVAPYANVAQPVAIETLVHEMCHIETYQFKGSDEYDPHGKAWTNCMLRIAESGGFKNVW